MNHTPGPWAFGHFLGRHALWVGPVGDDGQPLTPVAEVEWDSDMARNNARANARLIAAAPELLDALRAVVGRGYSETRHPAGQDYVSKDAIALVRAALAKVDA